MVNVLHAARLAHRRGRRCGGLRDQPDDRQARVHLDERGPGDRRWASSRTPRSARRWGSSTTRDCSNTSTASGIAWRRAPSARVCPGPSPSSMPLPSTRSRCLAGTSTSRVASSPTSTARPSWPGVLGHEIAHVTARHSAAQYSKQTAGSLGLLLGQIFVPELRPFGQAAEAGLGVLFLKFGRDDELRGRQPGCRLCHRAGMGSARRRQHARDARPAGGGDRPQGRAQLALDPPDAGRSCRPPGGARRGAARAGTPRTRRQSCAVPRTRRRADVRRQSARGRAPRQRVPAPGPALPPRVPRGLAGAELAAAGGGAAARAAEDSSSCNWCSRKGARCRRWPPTTSARSGLQFIDGGETRASTGCPPSSARSRGRCSRWATWCCARRGSATTTRCSASRGSRPRARYRQLQRVVDAQRPVVPAAQRRARPSASGPT